jgi:hypothetical protein
VLGISSPNLMTDYLVGVASFEHRRYAQFVSVLGDLACSRIEKCGPKLHCTEFGIATGK